jgi:hypothetical protein
MFIKICTHCLACRHCMHVVTAIVHTSVVALCCVDQLLVCYNVIANDFTLHACFASLDCRTKTASERVQCKFNVINLLVHSTDLITSKIVLSKLITILMKHDTTILSCANSSNTLFIALSALCTCMSTCVLLHTELIS